MVFGKIVELSSVYHGKRNLCKTDHFSMKRLFSFTNDTIYDFRREQATEYSLSAILLGMETSDHPLNYGCGIDIYIFVDAIQ